MSVDKESYVAPLRAAVATTLRQSRPLAPERVAAVCAELVAREGGQRLLYLRNSAWTRRPEVVQELVRRSHALRHAKPGQALELGRLAVRLARCLGSDHCAEPVALMAEAQAVASLGNLFRLRERYRAAEILLRRAQRTLDAAGGEPCLRALMLAYLGSLRIAQRRADEAHPVVEECLALYDRRGDRHSIGRARMLLARCYYNQLKPRDALRELRAAASYIDARAEPALGLDLLHNRFLYLEADGQGELALQLMEQAADLYREHATPDFAHQAWWLKGRLHTGHGELAEAVRHLEAAHQAFLSRGLPYDAALVSLDLALPLARLGLDHLVARLAREMYGVFTSKRIPREATAALLLFHDAAVKERADAALIESLVRELSPVRHASRR